MTGYTEIKAVDPHRSGNLVELMISVKRLEKGKVQTGELGRVQFTM